MKTVHKILALLFATLLVSAVSFAAEPHIQHKIELKLDGADHIAIETDDLEVGETRQFFTDSGKEVVLTREEDGLKIEVDGEELELGLHGGGHHAFVNVYGGSDKTVVIQKLGGDGAHAFAFGHGEGHGELHWVEKGEHGEGFSFVIERPSAADHLIESGVLDDLDEETRQNILDTLNELEPRLHVAKRVVVDVEVHEEE